MNNYHYYSAYKKILEDRSCPSCGMSTKELLEKGKIGCNFCIQTFRPELEAIVSRLQGRTKFSGRIPQGLAQILEKNFNLAETEEKLRKAIEEERYEDAAIYRDLIRDLKKKDQEEAEARADLDADADASANLHADHDADFGAQVAGVAEVEEDACADVDVPEEEV